MYKVFLISTREKLIYSSQNARDALKMSMTWTGVALPILETPIGRRISLVKQMAIANRLKV